MDRRGAEGFTLIELMTVVLILAALITIAVPVYAASSKQAAAMTCLASRTIVERGASVYRAKEGTSAATIGTLVSAGYLKTLPACPTKGIYVFDSRRDGGTDSVYCSVHFAGTAGSLFSGDPASGAAWLRSIMGAWSTSGGWLSPSLTNWQNRGVFGDPAWKDTTLTTKAILNSGSGYGIYFRTTVDGAGLPSGYCFQYDPGLGNKFVLRKVTGGAESGPIATTSMPSGFAVSGTPHDISVTTIGSHIVVKVDGVVVIDTVDTTFAQGQAGFRTWGSSNVQFGPVNVTPAVP